MTVFIFIYAHLEHNMHTIMDNGLKKIGGMSEFPRLVQILLIKENGVLFYEGTKSLRN